MVHESKQCAMGRIKEQREKERKHKSKPKLEAKQILLLECLPRQRGLKRKESLNCLAVHKKRLVTN